MRATPASQRRMVVTPIVAVSESAESSIVSGDTVNRGNNALERNPLPVVQAIESRRPSIHVTIRRIEIQAPPAANTTPTRRAEPRKPMLTLDEYLERRNGRSA